MAVIIGVDPHKATHTAVAIDHLESEVGLVRVRATRRQVPQLLDWAQPLGEHTWAIESAGGMGYLLAQQLAAAGETVVDVPATLASRIRVLGSGRSDLAVPWRYLGAVVVCIVAASASRDHRRPSRPPISAHVRARGSVQDAQTRARVTGAAGRAAPTLTR